MLEPSIDDLQTKIKSKYTLVTIAAKRARQIREEDKKVLVDDPKSNKYVGLALEEIMADKLHVKNDSN
ncbi:DNA-directed RNA polymerase subunit omega [Lentibacillus amyloliquefaciens]|uniref:DNA-directed RNA polymerase subunit omega n=1 Tax=Lentibacillus amyloliquefaciens TaxID=1472767 RepID=A0A0U4EB43_9BACI|nr:DNA-directed RNA polymerase subunit omega [Lentibacillus amyloliquefaciens]ALX50508.1 DNA-directed RNA polymerase subunit omega [Lentibacillus amyloliquefaciens]